MKDQRTPKARVLIVTHHDAKNGGRGGGDVAKVKQVRELLSGSCEVRVFGFRYFSDSGKLVWVLLAPYWILTLASEVLRTRWDSVYCFNQRYIVIYVWFLRLLTLRRYRIFYDVLLTWQLRSSGIYRKFRWRVEYSAIKCADTLVANSEWAREILSQGRETLLLPATVNVSVFQEQEEKRHEIRARYFTTDKDRIVGIIGPFDSEYNRPLLTFLAANIERFDDRIKFMVMGKFNERDEVRHENVIHTGYVDDYIAHLSALDAVLVVRNTPTDGPINRIVEAMAMELPVFANPIAARTIDHVTWGENIFVFEESEIARKTNELIFNDELLREAGRKARSIAKNHYAFEKFKSVICEALAESS
ncbi:glycosyltransferase [Chloroflexota bacterium]